MDGKTTAAADAGWGVAGALLLHVVMIALAVAWVAFYSYALEPGHGQAFYEAYAGRSSPIVSPVAGGPVFYLVAWRLARRRATVAPPGSPPSSMCSRTSRYSRRWGALPARSRSLSSAAR